MSGAGEIGGMNMFDSVMFWGTIFMVILEVMIVLLLVYDVGLHTIWGTFYRKKTRMFVRKFRAFTESLGTSNKKIAKRLVKKIGMKTTRGCRKK